MRYAAHPTLCMRLYVNLTNDRLLLIARPTGKPHAGHFAMDTQAIRPPVPGEVLVATRYISIDPAMRVWMDENPGYVTPIALGEPMRAGGVAEVIESNAPEFAPGDLVLGRVGWQSAPTLEASLLTKIDTEKGDPLAWLGPLGMTGMTAFFGLLHIGALRAGETVMVSAACGAVGQLVGQIAKAHGARAIGIAGGPRKCRLAVTEHGFDAAVDYYDPHYADLMPESIDIYFDNVGGPILDAAISKLATRGRVVVCGRISQTSADELYGVKNIGLLIGRRARLEGFVVSDFAEQFGEARNWLAPRLQSGEIHQRAHVLDGLASCPAGLAMLFNGENTGKLVVKL